MAITADGRMLSSVVVLLRDCKDGESGANTDGVGFFAMAIVPASKIILSVVGRDGSVIHVGGTPGPCVSTDAVTGRPFG